VRLLLDEQISGRVAAGLRKRGVDAKGVAEEAALRGLSDSDLFDFAQRDARALVTFNVADFLPIARELPEENRPHAGLILISPHRFKSNDFGGLIAALEALLATPPVDRGFQTWLQPPDWQRGHQ
jgi:predicted nuclease of predicted toxin-antitoxin system